MKRAGMGKLESEINEFCCCPGLHAGLKLKTSRLSHSSTITSHFPFGFPFRVFSLHLLAPTGITFLSFAMFSYKDCLQFDFFFIIFFSFHWNSLLAGDFIHDLNQISFKWFPCLEFLNLQIYYWEQE